MLPFFFFFNDNEVAPRSWKKPSSNGLYFQKYCKTSVFFAEVRSLKTENWKGIANIVMVKL